MISQFNIEYPLWWLILPPLLGGFYATLLYVKNSSNKLNNTWTSLLFIFRFISITLIALLLLAPFIKTSKKHIQKPILLVAVDNSKSMTSSNDSVYLATDFKTELHRIENAFKDDYDIERLVFGQSVKPFYSISFNEEGSDYSKLFAYIDEHYVSNDIDAMILVGDGIFNIGTDPVYASSNIKFPIYAIVVGDTVVSPDLRINDVAYNSFVYLNENIPLEVNFSAIGFYDENIRMNIYTDNKLQESKRIAIDNNNFNKTEHFDLSAISSGKMRIRVELVAEINENNETNNSESVFTDVLDSKQKVLILANSPHPDVSALRQAISGFKNYEVDTEFAGRQNLVVNDYSLIILHQLPSAKNPIVRVLNEIDKANTPIMVIVGQQTNLAVTKNLFAGLEFNSAVRSYENSMALFNPSFPLFNIEDSDISLLETLPPLKVHLGNYKSVNPSNVLAWQKIRSIRTSFPLIYFSQKEEQKQCLIMGEGLWLWRNYNYLEKSNFSSFDNLIGKTVQYLMVKADKRFFKIKSKGEYNTYDKIELQAELYNKSYEAIENADIELKLTNEKGDVFDFVFNSGSGSYKLELDTRESGIYQYYSTVTHKNQKYEETGEFVIVKKNFESQQLIANYDLLYKLTERNDGGLIALSNMAAVEKILMDKDVKNKISYSQTYSGLNNIPMVLALILLLLSLEWVLRKYLGTY